MEHVFFVLANQQPYLQLHFGSRHTLEMYQVGRGSRVEALLACMLLHHARARDEQLLVSAT